jgi:thiaminase/transcriptional activator TenA
MVRRWSEEAARLAQPMWDQILQHPFIMELLDGTLPIEKMRFYLEQDFRYIEGCVTNRLHAAAKAPDSEARAVALSYVLRFNEGQHIRGLLQLVGGDEAAKPMPACHAYMHHLRTIAIAGSTVEYLAGFIACPWSYSQIGRLLRGNMKHPIHQAWWQPFGGVSEAERRDFLGEHLAVIDRLALDASEAKWNEMLENFLISTRYEYWFWSMGYTLETWERHHERVAAGISSEVARRQQGSSSRT